MPWGFSELVVLRRCDGRRFTDSARRRHSSVGRVHGTTESLRAGPIPRHRATERTGAQRGRRRFPCNRASPKPERSFRPEPVFRRSRPPRATFGGIRNRRWLIPPALSGFALVGCGEPRCHPLRVPGLQQASPRPTPDVPRIDCLGERFRVELNPRPGICLVPTEGRCNRPAAAECHAERAGAGTRHRGNVDYYLERRHPAARASFSEQNHRSPFDVLIRVWS